MKIKKILLCTILLLIVGSFNLSKEASAANVINLDYLYEKAKSGVSDLSTNQMESILEAIDIQINESPNQFLNQGNYLRMNTPEIETYATAELLESDGDTKRFSVTVFSDISLFGDIQPIDYSTYASWPGNLTDHTGSVRAYLNLEVQAQTIDGASFLRLTGGSGNWTILDSRVKSITNRTVKYAVFGVIGSNGVPVNQNLGPYVLTSNSFSHSLSGANVATATDYQIMGGMEAVLSTTASSWDFKMGLRFAGVPYIY